MALQVVDETEDRNFQSGETIYDVDGNAYTVEGHHAVLRDGNTSIRYFLGRQMKLCFSRTNPRG